MKSIDAEIAQVEQSLAMRKVALRHNAALAKQRAGKVVLPPLAVIAAVGVGFAVAGRVARGKERRSAPVVAQDTKEQGKGFAVGTLAMTALTWFIRSQFGGPVGLAQFLLSKVRERRAAATAVPAELPR